MKSENKKGFSLIELLAAMAIVMIMSAIIVPRYATYKNTKSMSYAKTQLENDVRFAQSYSLSTKKLADGTSPVGGFGVHFDKGSSTYVIFGDRKHGASAPNHIYDVASAENELLETVSLVGNVTISKLTVNGSEVNSADYVSVPPYGKVFINGSNGNVTLVITFTNGVAGQVDTVSLSSSGFIS